MKEAIIQIVERYGNSPDRLMDILNDVQSQFRCVSDQAVSIIAEALGLSEVQVNETKSFYHFFTSEPTGKYAVYFNTSVTSMMAGMADVIDEFEKLCGIKVGQTTPDGLISLHTTSCIGMNDQEPAALINFVPFTCLNREKARNIYELMKKGIPAHEMVTEFGDGNNAHPLVRSMVKNNIRKAGPVTLGEYTPAKGLEKALSMGPAQVIDEVKNSNLRGRGGAGFPTGLKWLFCAQNPGPRYVICNADEGEPGTFKDRVLLTERAQMLFEGMTIAGYAIGSNNGILYIRKEYEYLKDLLENTLEQMRQNNLLGKNILGKGFDFDIRIQYGAGAYVCGEESALIESAEGKRGEPRNRPPFPVQRGYLNQPTIVNNVETFCSAVKIIENGSQWYTSLGTKESSGTKLLSISGDCKYPGVYEVEWGISVRELLDMVGAEDTQAVQVAGPSGVCINPSQFDRKIALEDLPTGGSIIVIGKHRDLIRDVVLNFLEFFEEESCGSCVPCRSLNAIMLKHVKRLLNGKLAKSDIDKLAQWAEIQRKTTRCGLGQTASNPVATTILNFRHLYEAKAVDAEYVTDFDFEKAIQESCEVVGRPARLPIHHE